MKSVNEPPTDTAVCDYVPQSHLQMLVLSFISFTILTRRHSKRDSMELEL